MTDSYTTAPADISYAIVPSDTQNLPRRPRALRVVTAGILSIMDMENNVSTFNVADNEIIPFRPKRVMAATTAVVLGWE